MDAFEQLVSEILWMEGYWVRTSLKVDLTKEEKVAIGRPSAPRWELDIVAYSARDNLLRVIECKSYLDSRGVGLSSFVDAPDSEKRRYKLFHEPILREVVFGRLGRQFSACGACLPDPEIRLGLACGKVSREADRAPLHAHFEQSGWDLLDEPWLRDRLKVLSTGSYENQVSAVVAKLLLRGKL